MMTIAERLGVSSFYDYVERFGYFEKTGTDLPSEASTIFHKEENMGNVQWFLEQNPEFQLSPIQDYLCGELQGDVKEEGCLQLLPGVHNSDGFFIAKFRRK